MITEGEVTDQQHLQRTSLSSTMQLSIRAIVIATIVQHKTPSFLAFVPFCPDDLTWTDYLFNRALSAIW